MFSLLIHDWPLFLAGKQTSDKQITNDYLKMNTSHSAVPHTSASLFRHQYLPDFAIINYFLYSSFSIY
ncbi:hypothetical protein BGI03_08240 [Snodgrassella alvi]|nr:hypothetical protein BGH98_10790 [Snodgrassella alvi]ORF10726.1 hypothetical protein BGI01_10470 [Snodgrassella alvi]ORF17075.1 hypothetical protein BGI03_08240 [Snodgrassella alvi]ORF17649.1 hypothetical protein BGI04_09800 [Snodgrassella alvi]